MSEQNTDVTPELLAATYDLGGVVGWARAAEGSAGEIHRLVTATGTYAAKEFVAQRPTAVDLAWRVAFTDACRAAGVPGPETLRTTGGDLLFDHPGTGRPWLVQPWVEGTRPERTDLPATVWLAGQAALIHQLEVPCRPGEEVHPFYVRVDADWAGLADSARGSAWGTRLAERAAEFAELTAFVNAAPVGTLVSCHRDLKTANTLLGPDGDRFLLDWDTSGPQEPWRELGTLLIHHVRDDAAVGAIAGAYRKAGGPGWPAGATLFATGLAVWLNFLDGQVCTALDESADADDRAFAESIATRLTEDIPGFDVLGSAAGVAAGS
ncbi:phosphotransferase [Longispora sp. NPDC051575]|uniref:phosphotransferase enzyme family protein n=1 Tax=Longispora sp. NPDC051575 TaxID=3154943 RepID=UPI0034421870